MWVVEEVAINATVRMLTILYVILSTIVESSVD